MTEDFKCPRRDPSFDKVSKLPLTDRWVQVDGMRCCSYCGSLHPDDFMSAIEAGEEVVPTDKNYKAYLKTSGFGQRKFYYPHLSAEQRTQFIALHNERKMKIAQPWHFYVPPYFCAIDTKEGA